MTFIFQHSFHFIFSSVLIISRTRRLLYNNLFKFKKAKILAYFRISCIFGCKSICISSLAKFYSLNSWLIGSWPWISIKSLFQWIFLLKSIICRTKSVDFSLRDYNFYWNFEGILEVIHTLFEIYIFIYCISAWFYTYRFVSI